uniref:Uncharacterized protein n=1 Tax=Vitis vinifera TaxID=29760 RepID=F6HJI8_VITVI
MWRWRELRQAHAWKRAAWWWSDGVEEFESFLEVAAGAEKANVVEKIDGFRIQGHAGRAEASEETRKNIHE